MPPDGTVRDAGAIRWNRRVLYQAVQDQHEESTVSTPTGRSRSEVIFGSATSLKLEAFGRPRSEVVDILDLMYTRSSRSAVISDVLD